MQWKLEMVLYSHRLNSILQQVVVELGLDLVLSDENSPLSLQDNEPMRKETAMMLNVDVKKLSAKNGSILFKFQRRA